MQEEEQAAAEKATKKRQREEAKEVAKTQPKKPRGRPSKADKVGSGEPTEVATPKKAAPKTKAKAKAKASPKTRKTNQGAKKSRSPKAAAKASPKAKAKGKAKAEPKKAPGKREVGDEKADGTPRLRENRNSSAAAKTKRRERADRVFADLCEESLPGFVVPKELGGKISFTQADPAKEGASIGVVLYSESFYITKPAPPASWPSTCNFLKARLYCKLHS